MNKMLVILGREFRGTLFRKGFLITTLALPILGLLAILIFQVVSAVDRPEKAQIQKIGYIDRAGIASGNLGQGQIELAAYENANVATSDLISGIVREYFVIPENYLETGEITRYSLKTDLETPADSLKAMRDFLITSLVQEQLSPQVSARILSPVALSSVVLDQTGNVANSQGGLGAAIIPYIFGLLLIMSIFTASGYLLQGLSEEKENRIMEVLLSSISTRQLIAGKVLGLGAAGLVQILFWLLSAWGLLALASSGIGGVFATLQIPPQTIALGLVYYILGYFLFAVLLAGIGAIVPTVRDGQQFSVVVTMMGAIPFFLMTFIIENGNHALSIVLTLLPPTAPLTVMLRLNAGIPTWQLALSIFLLALSVIGSLLLASRLFRTYLLMFGKTPGVKEIFRALRQA